MVMLESERMCVAGGRWDRRKVGQEGGGAGGRIHKPLGALGTGKGGTPLGMSVECGSPGGGGRRDRGETTMEMPRGFARSQRKDMGGDDRGGRGTSCPFW